ncbi:hypothetical protein ACHHYP_12410 [Achlya hypogyna]|uniref:Uncharacterized protein n=1 Tax=Achlya hypogyna TaxID=1202772 RepID=A0A1V9YH44_ACHHY|nr:hypothetical protein ACHHYP_12410 [Achlya hypogyna]
MAGVGTEDALTAGLRNALAHGYAYVDRMTLVLVHRPNVFHPALVFTKSDRFILVMELHPNLPATFEWPLLSSIVSETHGMSLNLPPPLLDVLPFDTVVNTELLSGVPEAKARGILAAILRVIAKDESLHVDILVGFQGGYVGQSFGDVSYTTTTVTQTKTPPASMLSIDAALESTLRCVPGAKKLSHMQVVAGYSLFNLPWGLQHTVEVWSTWEGIENTCAIGCKPPPLCASIVRIGDLPALAHTSLKDCFTDPFPAHFTRHVHLMQSLEESMSAQGADTTFRWPVSTAPLDLQQLLMDPDRVLLSTIDSIEDPTLAATVLRPDMDFLEKTWHLVAHTAPSTAAVVTVCRELQSCFGHGSVLPLIHSDNTSDLAGHLRQLVRQVQHERYDHSEIAPDAAPALAQDDAACLGYMLQVGVYKLQRDLAHWLGQQGVVLPDLVAFASTRAALAAALPTVYACAIGKLLGFNASVVRQVAQQALDHAQSGSAHAPTFSTVFDSFLPDRLRLSLQEPFAWSLSMQVDSGVAHTVSVDERAVSGTEFAPFAIAPAKAERLLDSMCARGTEAESFLEQGVAAFETTIASSTTQFYDCKQRTVKYPGV